MNAKTQILSDQVIALYRDQRAQLGALTTATLVDLQHECEELLHHEDFSIRTAAEINRTCCVLILEERRRNQ